MDRSPELLAFDVSMDVVNVYTQSKAESLEMDFENRTDVTERHLTDLKACQALDDLAAAKHPPGKSGGNRDARGIVGEHHGPRGAR